MDAGKEQTDDSGEVSLEDLCHNSCSVLMSAKKSTKYLLSPKSTGKKKLIYFLTILTAHCFFSSVGFAKEQLVLL